MANVPAERLHKKNQFVFGAIGLGFKGPFPVKNNGKLSSRSILLFTSLALRAVHLEVLNDHKTDSKIN